MPGTNKVIDLSTPKIEVSVDYRDFTALAVEPTSPTSGHFRMFADQDGNMMIKDSSGNTNTLQNINL